VSPKKRGCEIKQHPDLLYGFKQRCNFWASGTKHNHWSFPSYFVSEYSCMHSLINNQTQLLRIQIGNRIAETNVHISHSQKLPESTSFLTPKYSSKFRLLLRSSPSYVHHHLLGQVASAAENSNNQPSLLKQNSTLCIHKDNQRVQASLLQHIPQRSNSYSAKNCSPQK